MWRSHTGIGNNAPAVLAKQVLDNTLAKVMADEQATDNTQVYVTTGRATGDNALVTVLEPKTMKHSAPYISK